MGRSFRTPLWHRVDTPPHQDMAIASFDESQALPEASHDGVALGHGLPGGGTDPLNTKNDLRNILKGRTGLAAINDLKHLPKVAPAIRGQAWIRIRGRMVECGDKAPNRVHSIIEERIEWNDSRHRTCGRTSANAQGGEPFAVHLDMQITPFGGLARVSIG